VEPINLDDPAIAALAMIRTAYLINKFITLAKLVVCRLYI
jgi:hypothetical protein